MTDQKTPGASSASLLNDGLCVEEDKIAEFYKHLLERQEPLPADFAKILNDNLWDLYES
jgi:hypothetical protein